METIPFQEPIISLTGLSALSIAFSKPNVMATSRTLDLDFGDRLQVVSSSSNCLFYYPASVKLDS